MKTEPKDIEEMRPLVLAMAGDFAKVAAAHIMRMRLLVGFDDPLLAMWISASVGEAWGRASTKTTRELMKLFGNIDQNPGGWADLEASMGNIAAVIHRVVAEHDETTAAKLKEMLAAGIEAAKKAKEAGNG